MNCCVIGTSIMAHFVKCCMDVFYYDALEWELEKDVRSTLTGKSRKCERCFFGRITSVCEWIFRMSVHENFLSFFLLCSRNLLFRQSEIKKRSNDRRVYAVSLPYMSKKKNFERVEGDPLIWCRSVSQSYPPQDVCRMEIRTFAVPAEQKTSAW
jgi:hypothetical protein